MQIIQRSTLYYDCARLNYCLFLNSTAYYSHLMLKYDKICDIIK